jgi:cytochrome c-type biogenesis protein CcmE
MGNSVSASKIPRGGLVTGGRLKFFVGGAIIVVVLAWLIFSNIQGASAQYLSVEELLAQGPSDRMVRVSGLVLDETIDWDPQQLVLRFQMADEGGSIPVVYEGVRPDMFRDGAQVVVEGKQSSSGAFQANTLLLKCPSKYVEE